MELRPPATSSHWKRRLGGAGLFLLLSLPGAAADLAAARNWLEIRYASLLADTSTPVRTIALTALALDTPEARKRAFDVLGPRQGARGGWTEPGEPGAVDDQTAALRLCSDTDAAARGARFLLGTQTKEGGWTTTLNRRDHADTLSTAQAVQALVATSRALDAPRELDAALQRARAFVISRQDPATGVIGDESRGLGHWASTVAGAWVLATGGDPRDLALRRARHALAGGAILQQGPQRPLLALDFLPDVLAGLPAAAAARLRTPLQEEILRRQATDGHWSPPARQNGVDDVLATALLTAGLSGLARELPPAASPQPLAWRPVAGGRILVTFPAEPADLILLPPARADRPLVTGFDESAVITTLLARACGADGNGQPWVEPLLELARGWNAGPTSYGAAAREVMRQRKAEPLLDAADFAAELDRLDEKTLRRLAGIIADRPVETLFDRAHAAWAHEDDAALNQCLEAVLPAALRPAVAALRAKAAVRLREKLAQGPADVVLDAWLALGEDGVLARLGSARANK